MSPKIWAAEKISMKGWGEIILILPPAIQFVHPSPSALTPHKSQVKRMFTSSI